MMVKIPERAELEAREFTLELERLRGRPAYLDAEDMGVMYGVVTGDIQSGDSSRVLLRDGLQQLLTGDIPPQLMHDVVCDVRVEVEDVLGYGWCQSFADDKENSLRHPGRGPTHNELPSTRRLQSKVHGRRWKLEEAERDAVLSSSEDEGFDKGEGAGLANGEKQAWQEQLPHVLLDIWNACSGGGVVAEGHVLEEAMLQNRRLRALLGGAGVEFGYGSVKLLQDQDVLKSEFLRNVRKAFDHQAESSSDLSDDLGGSDSDD